MWLPTHSEFKGGKKHEAAKGFGRDQTEDAAENQADIAHDFHHRPKQLEQQKKWERQPADHARAWVEQQAAVGCQAFGQAALPAGPLPLEHGQRLRRFGPANWIGYVADPVGLAGQAVNAVQAHDQLHILAHGVGAISARLNDRRFLEQAKGAGNY